MTRNHSARLFTGIPLPDPVRQELAALQTAERTGGPDPGITWQQSRNLHLTLNFIGAVDHAEIHTLSDALASIRGAPFSLHLEGVGYFGPAKQPRVLWVGANADNALHTLQQQALNALKTSGFQPDDKTYHPHVTLGRCRPYKRTGEAAAHWLNTHENFQGPTLQVDGFCLFESTRDDKGLRYDIIETFKLNKG